jgi:hypothetical protein
MIRRALLVIVVIGLAGTIVELVLIKHTDGAWELAPLALLGASVLVFLWHAVSRGATSLRAVQGVMVLFIISGALGVLLHFQGNIEFEKESMPGINGLALIWKAVRGATPTLAPGAMLQLGLVGLAYAYRHPALLAPTDADGLTTGRN